MQVSTDSLLSSEKEKAQADLTNDEDRNVAQYVLHITVYEVIHEFGIY